MKADYINVKRLIKLSYDQIIHLRTDFSKPINFIDESKRINSTKEHLVILSTYQQQNYALTIKYHAQFLIYITNFLKKPNIITTHQIFTQKNDLNHTKELYRQCYRGATLPAIVNRPVSQSGHKVAVGRSVRLR